MTTEQKIRQVLSQNPSWGRFKVAEAVGISPNTVGPIMSRIRGPKPGVPPITKEPPAASDREKSVLDALAHGPKTPRELQDDLNISGQELFDALKDLKTHHHVVTQSGTRFHLSKPGFGRLPVEVIDGGDWTRVGLVADTHLCCKEERLDALHAIYDLFKKEGIDKVFHAGNIVDGYVEKLNGTSVFSSTIDGQCDYCIDNYPQRDGVTTYFITGDDHEAWFMRQGLNFGGYLQAMAEKEGRTDLQYLGHVEADVEFINKAGHATIMKVQHPGGGSSYARSYTGQKQVEAFQGGEKPAILIQGHYHVSNYMNDRNVHVVGMPGFQDQTIFARKKRLRMEIGGAIMEFKQNEKDGAVTRFRLEFQMFFDRTYYKKFLRSDSVLAKGHLTIKTK